MKDLTIRLENRPGALAEMGEALGRADISIEGGGAFVVEGDCIAHFLFDDGPAARKALEDAGIEVIGERDVVRKASYETEKGPVLGLITQPRCATRTVSTISHHSVWHWPSNCSYIVGESKAQYQREPAWCGFQVRRRGDLYRSLACGATRLRRGPDAHG